MGVLTYRGMQVAQRLVGHLGPSNIEKQLFAVYTRETGNRLGGSHKSGACGWATDENHRSSKAGGQGHGLATSVISGSSTKLESSSSVVSSGLAPGNL